jgi:Leucine-rich repeat (LRR) protein
LKKLDLSGCGLTEFSESFMYFYELEELNLSNNPLGPSFIFPTKLEFWFQLKKLDLSGCGLKEWPCALEKCSNLQELNLSNNSIGHEELLEELNSGKMFISHLSLYKSGKIKGPFGPMTRIIFEDTVFTQRNGG